MQARASGGGTPRVAGLPGAGRESHPKERGAAESWRPPSPIPEAAGRAGGDREGVLTATPSLREFHFSKDWAPLSDLGACIKALS